MYASAHRRNNGADVGDVVQKEREDTKHHGQFDLVRDRSQEDAGGLRRRSTGLRRTWHASSITATMTPVQSDRAVLSLM